MPKRIIRLTEQYLHNIVKESVNRILNESSSIDYCDVDTKILKESPKAYYIAVKYFTQKGLSEKEAKMWCPKSCCVLDNGNITKVARFILDKWIQEYYDFIKSKGYKSSQISFDMDELKYNLDKKKAEKDEYETYYDEVFNKLVEYIEPIFENNMKEMGSYSKMLGMYLLNNGLVSSDKCQKLVELGDILIQKFGNGDDSWSGDFFNGNPNRKDLYQATNDVADIFYGFNKSKLISKCPISVKYSATDIVAYEIKSFNGYYEKKEGRLYRMFKKYAEYVDKFNEVAFDALNSIKRT